MNQCVHLTPPRHIFDVTLCLTHQITPLELTFVELEEVKTTPLAEGP